MGMKYRENANEPWREIEMLRGPKGEDGFSPSLSVERITGGYRLTITDATGSKSIDVMNGEDAVSPTVAVSNITGGHRITITDKNGTNTIDVMNGNDGKDGASATHYWDGTVLVVTSASGSSSADLKGETGDDGYTPVKGTDYWTDEDKQSIIDEILSMYPDAEMESF